MVYVRRISPDDGLIREILDHRSRIRSIETRPSGNITSREEFRSINEDGIETVIGSDGLEEYINDITPPNRPSAPSKLEPTIGGILLTWNGKDWIGEPQPKDYSHTDVEVSDNDGATWTVASVVTATSPNTTITGLVSGKTYSVRLRSFDQNKNESEYSSIVGGGKTVDLVDPTEMINELREEHGAAMDDLESLLSNNTEEQTQLKEDMKDLREVTIPGVERTIEEAQQSIIGTEEALALIPGDIAAAKKAAIDAADASAKSAIAAAQMSGNSLVKNGNFEDGNVGWANTTGVTYIAAAARAGTLGMRVAPTTTNVWPINSSEIQTSTGRTYYMEMWVKRTGTDITSTGSIGFVPLQKNTAGVSSSPVVVGYVTEGVTMKTGDISTTTFTKVSAEFTITTADINRIQFSPWFKGPTSNVYFVDDILVVDITESKIALSKAISTASADAATKIAAAEAAMAIVAQGFANKAKDDAISSSLSTAIEKANTAQADAISSARLEAELLATAARDAAISVADAAQRAADTAIDNAKAASDLAGTKGKVLAQTTAPGAADRNANTLWIDTSGTPAGNIPKKWVSGTTWTAVTDKTAADAAAAAAKAISDAEAARKLAVTAEESAGNAMQAAGSKTKVHYSTANPSGIGAVGDTWRKIDSSGDVIGEWRYTGGTTPWTAQLVTSTMLSNVDIGKLTVGTSLMQTGVADEFFAKIFSTNKLYAENIIIGEAGNSHPDPFFKDTEGWKPFSILPTGGRNGNPALVIPASTAVSGHYYGVNDRNRQFPVVEKSTYRVSVWVKADAATPANGVSLYAKWTNPTTAISGVACTPSNVNAPALVANVWTPLTGLFDFPAGASRGLLGFYTQASTNVRVLFSEPTVVRLIDDALVAEGGIKARSIEASEEMSAKIGRFLEVKTSQLVSDTANFKTGVAEKFAAGIGSFLKLNATQVYIGEGGNLFPTDFNDDGWQSVNGITVSATGGKTGGSSMLIPASTTQIGSYYGIDVNKRSRAPRLIPGMTYLVRANVRSEKAIPVGGARIYVRLYNIASEVTTGYTWATPSSIVNEKAIALNTWGEVEGQITIPEGHPDTVAVIGMYSTTISTGALRLSELTIQAVITPSLVVDGLVSGQNIIGSTIRTSSTLNRGVVLSKDGMVAYNSTGAETLRFDGANSIITGATYRTASTGARVQLSTAAGLEIWTAAKKVLTANSSGLEMDGTVLTKGTTYNGGRDLNIRVGLVPTNVNGGTATYDVPGVVFERPGISSVPASGYPSHFPAGMTGTYDGDGVEISSSRLFNNVATQITVNGPNITLTTGTAGTTTVGGVIAIGNDSYPATREMNIFANIMNIGKEGLIQNGAVFRPRSSVYLMGDVHINSRLMGDTGWKTVSYASPWASYGNGFSPLSYRVLYGTLYLMGSIKGGVSGSRVTTLPAGFRPTIPTGTEALEAPLTATQGGQWYAGSLWIYGDGRVVYTAPPGQWSGADRAIVNASFPLL